MDESDRLRKELYKASRQGDANALIKLIEEDELVLERTITSSSETPLHIAAMLGHVEFTKEVLSRKPDLAWEFDYEGFSPLHLASARKNIEMVRELARAEPDVCLSTDSDGRTPLHLAAMKGRVKIMEELLQCRPQAIDKVLLSGGETILHLCTKHSRLEALELLLQWVPGNEITRRGTSSSSRWGKRLNEYEKWLEKKQNTVMVVASLIASIGFQAILNPPSKFSLKPRYSDRLSCSPSQFIWKRRPLDDPVVMDQIVHPTISSQKSTVPLIHPIPSVQLSFWFHFFSFLCLPWLYLSKIVSRVAEITKTRIFVDKQEGELTKG